MSNRVVLGMFSDVRSTHKHDKLTLFGYKLALYALPPVVLNMQFMRALQVCKKTIISPQTHTHILPHKNKDSNDTHTTTTERLVPVPSRVIMASLLLELLEVNLPSCVSIYFDLITFGWCDDGQLICGSELHVGLYL